MANSKYFVKEEVFLYRRRDGDARYLPDEVLWPDGWVQVVGSATTSADTYPEPSRRGTADGGADPNLLITLSPVTESQARVIARDNGLPTEGW